MTQGTAAGTTPPTLLTRAYDRLVAQDSLNDDPQQRAMLVRLEGLRERVEAPRMRRRAASDACLGAYIWGDVGRGKTMLMDLFLANTATEAKRRVHFDAFLRDLHAAIHRARRDRKDDPMRAALAALTGGLRLLALDEIQVNDIADAMILRRVFDDLFAAGVCVLTTSNRPPQDLYRNGPQRALFVPFITLLTDRCEVLHLPGEQDHRRSREGSGSGYFHPDDAAATARLDSVWDGLTQGRASAMVLEVQGRAFMIPAHHDGVARTTFAQLCGQTHSPADYLALAGQLRLLLLDHVPRLSEVQHDEARRFITLVDALYEAKVRLILSASTGPEALYPAGDGADAFRRLVSRLYEMQRWNEGDALLQDAR